MATASLDLRTGTYRRLAGKPVNDPPGVVELDRGPIEGDDLDELYWRSDRHGFHKFRCTSTDRDRALAIVEAKYYEIKNGA